MFNYAPGTQVMLAATPDPGSFFDGWMQNPLNPACMGIGACLVVMNSNQTVGYTFLPNNAPPPQPDFTLTITPASLGSISVGTQGVAAIGISTMNGFSDEVNLSCSVLPSSTSSPSCAINPGALTIPVSGAGSATLTINTTGLTAERRSIVAILAFCIPILGTLLGGGKKSHYSLAKRRWVRLLLFGMLLGVMCLGVACGSGGGQGAGGVAQPGTYTVSITAQGVTTGVIHTTQATVTVQ